MPKLTKRFVESLPVKASSYFVWDIDVIGFGIRVMPSGTRTYQVQYRRGARTRRSAIGRHGVVSADQARSRARELLGLVAIGNDPVEDIARERTASTVAALCDRFLEVHVAERCKPNTARDYRGSVKRMIKPKLGSLKVTEIARSDIADLHFHHRETPYQANRMLSLLSKMFNMAEIWGLRPDGSNPCRHVAKYPEPRRERFLTASELETLGGVLQRSAEDGSETAHVIAAIRLLILTGCRLSEIQQLRWDFITGRGIELPDSKTGARCIPLPTAAREILTTLPRTSGNPYVIEGRLANSHITDLQRPWQRLRKKAGLDDVRIHDLRHTYASVAVSGGMPIQMVGRLLGHSQMQTTLRYAHLADDPVQKAAEENSSALSAALQKITEKTCHLRVVK